MRGIAALVASGFGFLFFLVFAFSTYYTVGQGERGVITHYGAVVGLSQPGLHFKMPFVTSVENISIQPQVITYGGKDHNLAAYSRDQQPANIQVSVNYHATDVLTVYSNFGSLDTMETRIIDPKVYEQLKNVFGQFDAADAIQHRAVLNGKVFAAIRDAVKGPVVIDSVQIQDIAFSDQYEQAIETRMQAIVKQQQAEAEKQQRITNADAAAYEVKAQADANAHAVQVAGEAEAGAIKAKGDALRDNPGVPALIIANKWNGELPQIMPPNGSVPMLSLPRN